jgi:hypothetical protein
MNDINWRFDLENMPNDGINFLAYFPLEGLGEHWARCVPVFIDKDGRFVFTSRACAGYSDECKPSAWANINVPVPPTVEEIRHKEEMKRLSVERMFGN